MLWSQMLLLLFYLVVVSLVSTFCDILVISSTFSDIFPVVLEAVMTA